MKGVPRAVIVSIGEELLEGRILDLNSRYFAEELLRLGFLVRQMHTVGDEPGGLRALLQELASRFDLILTTGGLGPTVDDRVREEVAGYLGVPLDDVDGAAEPLAELYRRQQEEDPPPWFLAQARVPMGAKPLRNRAGTAWGFLCELDPGTWLCCLPGPPRECQSAFLDGGARDALVQRFGSGDEIAFGSFHTSGMVESAVEARIRDLMETQGNPRLGIVASGMRVTVSVMAYRDPDGRSAREVLEGTAEELARRLGEQLWGRDEDTLPGVVVRELHSRGQTVALAESCTGGRLAGALTSVPGASEVFGFGWCTYANHAKTQELGVAPELLETRGAVSPEVAAAMAVGARERARADWAVSVTGIAGPEGGSAEKPVGLVYLGIAGAQGVHVVKRRQYARAGRSLVQQQSVRDALDGLRRAITGLAPLPDRD